MSPTRAKQADRPYGGYGPGAGPAAGALPLVGQPFVPERPVGAERAQEQRRVGARGLRHRRCDGGGGAGAGHAGPHVSS